MLIIALHQGVNQRGPKTFGARMRMKENELGVLIACRCHREKRELAISMAFEIRSGSRDEIARSGVLA